MDEFALRPEALKPGCGTFLAFTGDIANGNIYQMPTLGDCTSDLMGHRP